MDGRQELLAYLGAATVTVVGLFTLQLWYESYLDVSVVHARYGQAGANEQVSAKRAEEQRRLAGGKVSIEAAIKQLSERGRGASPRLAPTPSEDLSAMAGWVHRPGFEVYVPRKPAPAVAVVPAPSEAAPVEGAPSEAAPAAAPSEPSAAPTAEAPAHATPAPTAH